MDKSSAPFPSDYGNETEEALLRAVKQARDTYESAPAENRSAARQAYCDALHALNRYMQMG